MSKIDNADINLIGRVGTIQKDMIALVLVYDIIDVRTYKGDKGDLLLEVSTLSNNDALEIECDAKSLGFEVVILQDAIAVYKVYCILYNTSNVYALKSI